ncbi:MAG: transcription termination/antitermination protein NusG [Candidatus Cloacimonadia bacterium]
MEEIKELYGRLALPKNGSTWYAVWTKPRREKKVAKACVDYSISYFLPLRESCRRYHNRVLTFTKPLFPGYIFCCCDIYGKRQLYQLGHICKFIEAKDQETLVQELSRIYNLRQKGAQLFPHTYLQRGKSVRIIKGPFAGFKGKISHRKDKYRLVLNIDLIKQAVALEIDAENVELIE